MNEKGKKGIESRQAETADELLPLLGGTKNSTYYENCYFRNRYLQNHSTSPSFSYKMKNLDFINNSTILSSRKI